MIEQLQLLDWKRRIAALYADVRAAQEPIEAWEQWRSVRDELFRSHPQSPLPDAAAHSQLSYFEYDPAYRITGRVRPAEPAHYEIPTSGQDTMTFERCGIVEFAMNGVAHDLELYWLTAYGGGLFLPFRDGTSGTQTYGAGRYLLDTVKGADLGSDGELLVLDFNFSYNPSCSYDDRWVCPLAPPANHLDVSVEAGERM